MAEFLRKKIGDAHYQRVMDFLKQTQESPMVILRKQPLDFLEVLLSDLLPAVDPASLQESTDGDRASTRARIAHPDVAKQLKDRIRLLEVICKGSSKVETQN